MFSHKTLETQALPTNNKCEKVQIWKILNFVTGFAIIIYLISFQQITAFSVPEVLNYIPYASKKQFVQNQQTLKCSDVVQNWAIGVSIASAIVFIWAVSICICNSTKKRCIRCFSCTTYLISSLIFALFLISAGIGCIWLSNNGESYL